MTVLARLVSGVVACAAMLTFAYPAVTQAQKATVDAQSARTFRVGAVTVRAPWARATPGGAKVAGVYLELVAAEGVEDRLIAVRSPASKVVEIHDHVDDGGVMRMRRVEAIAVKGTTVVTLKPGGLHVMLMELTGPLKAGETIKLALVFEKAGEVEIEAPVVPVGAQLGPGQAHGSGAGAHGARGSGSGSGSSR